MSRSESNFSIPAQTPVEVRKVVMNLMIVGQGRDVRKNIAFASLKLNEVETILLAISDSGLSYTTDPTVVMNALVLTSAK